MKAYFTTLANRPLRLGGREFKFTVFSIAAGRANGYFETEDPAEIAILDDAVQGRRGVKEISIEEVEIIKKNQSTRSLPSSNVSRPRPVRIPTLPEIAVQGRGSAPSAASPGAAKNGNETLFSGDNAGAPPSIKSLLRVRRVNPPQPFAKSVEKTAKASARADRAKVRVARPAVDAG